MCLGYVVLGRTGVFGGFFKLPSEPTEREEEVDKRELHSLRGLNPINNDENRKFCVFERKSDSFAEAARFASRFGMYKVQKAGMIVSEPGGKKQRVHMDQKGAKWKQTFSVLVASQNCCLLVYSLQQPKESERNNYSKVLLKEGECLVFRTDLWHCGYSYEERNIRFHIELVPIRSNINLQNRYLKFSPD